jgi:CheY-like chemotaxis protein
MSRTILLADDSVTIQKVVELTFMDQDWEVVAVGDGKAALAKLSEEPPALLIADVHMPGAGGYEVCRRAKEIHPGLPVLLLVGTFEPFDEQQAAASGADGHLKKPFDSQDLLAQVEALAGGRAATSPPMEAAADEPEVSELEPPSLTADASGAVELELEPADSPAPEDDLFELPPLDAAPEPELAAPAPPPPAASAERVSSRTAPIELPTLAAPEPVADAAAPEEPEPVPPAVEVAPAAPAAAPAPTPVAAAAAAPAGPDAQAGNGNGSLSDQDVDRVARRVAELVGEKLLREVAWEVVPDLAELIIKERIRELESQVE